MQTDSGLNLLQKANVLLVQGEDPWQDPTGGMVAVTKCLLRTFGDRIAVASPSEESIPEGVWFSRSFEDQHLAFFSLGPLGLKRGKRPMVPAKVSVYRRVRKYMRQLHGFGVRNLMMDCAEVLFAARRFGWGSVCYQFPGLQNPVAHSRYPWARILGQPYERMLVRSLKQIRPEAIVAAADQPEIDRFLKGPGRILDPTVVHSFPTRVDTGVFFPEPINTVRDELGLPLDDLTLVVCGRLNWVKGWKLLLEVLQVLTTDSPSVRLVFVGDGEDRPKIVEHAANRGLEKNITITGLLSQQSVRKYLNAADVCVVASHYEGWSVAMLEILACGKPLVSTDVSGSGALIREGHNGFIVRSREPQEFAASVRKAAGLPDVGPISLEIVKRYSIEFLARDLGRVWKPLATTS